MNSKLWIRKALSACLSVAVLATYSMVALAGTGRVAGELTVSGKSADSDAPFVVVNGEAARTGRSVFSSSIINTPDSTVASINFGRLGQIEIAPNSLATLSFDENGIRGELTSGKLTVRGTENGVNIKTADGSVVKLNAGDSVTAAGKAQDDASGNGGGAAWWGLAAVMVGAGALIIWAATRDNDIELGGGGTVVSPSR